MTFEHLVSKYEGLRNTFTHFGTLADPAKLITEFLSDLDAAQRDDAAVTLSLSEAAVLSGFSKGHLARLINRGDVPNAGKENRPRVRKGDLPKKRGTRAIAASSPRAYDPNTDALSLMGRLKEAR